MSTPIRVMLWQGAVPAYRAPVWRMLAEHPEIDLTLLRGETPGQRSVELSGVKAERVRLVHTPVGLDWYPSQFYRPHRGEVDVAIVPWSSRSLSAGVSIGRCRRLGIGTVAWGHGVGKGASGWRDRVRNVLGRSADVAMVYSRGVADRLVQAGGFERDRLFVAANSMDTGPAREERRRLMGSDALQAFRDRLKLDGPTLLFVSRLIPSKCPEMVVEVVGALRHRYAGLKAILIGDGPQKEAVLSSADRLGVRDAIVMPGAIYDEHELAPFFCASDVFCYPKGIGLSLQHAFAYGLPVVTDDDMLSHGPEAEALVHEQNGLVYRSGDSAGMAEAVGRLLHDRALWSRCSSNAAWAVDPKNPESFSAERMVDGFVASIRAARDRVQAGS